jgi:hypothetical protein
MPLVKRLYAMQAEDANVDAKKRAVWQPGGRWRVRIMQLSRTAVEEGVLRPVETSFRPAEVVSIAERARAVKCLTRKSRWGLDMLC